jgi:molybdopterin molybdotransferase
MISVTEAKEILSKYIIQGQPVYMPLEEALGMFLAEDIPSDYDIPFFDNSAMDGYAIAWNDGDNKRKLRPETKIRAGELEDFVLDENEAIRIFTGAPVPKGADTIIPQEWVKIDGNIFSFEIDKFEKGSNLRSQGAQNKVGDIIALKGSEITPGMIALLSSVGMLEVRVFSKPKVGIILTGDELEEIGKPLSFGKVYNSNGPVLKTYLKQLGIDEVELATALDEPAKLQKTIDRFLEKYDVVLISGGISVGDYDFVKGSLEKAGVKELFYKIRQKPGKPLFVGQRKNQWIFALPGNPASTLTCFNQYVKPCLMAWMGKTNVWEPIGSFPLVYDYIKKAGISHFLKAKLQNGSVHILPGQESFNLISYGTANCIAEIAEETESVQAGTPVNVYVW